jgi:hypothetical protein
LDLTGQTKGNKYVKNLQNARVFGAQSQNRAFLMCFWNCIQKHIKYRGSNNENLCKRGFVFLSIFNIFIYGRKIWQNMVGGAFSSLS